MWQVELICESDRPIPDRVALAVEGLVGAGAVTRSGLRRLHVWFPVPVCDGVELLATVASDLARLGAPVRLYLINAAVPAAALLCS